MLRTDSSEAGRMTRVAVDGRASSVGDGLRGRGGNIYLTINEEEVEQARRRGGRQRPILHHNSCRFITSFLCGCCLEYVVVMHAQLHLTRLEERQHGYDFCFHEDVLLWSAHLGLACPVVLVVVPTVARKISS